jgi:hypothetical protein
LFAVAARADEDERNTAVRSSYPATCVYAMTKAAVATMVNLAMAQKAAAFNERLWDWNDDDLAHLAALLRRLIAVPAMG